MPIAVWLFTLGLFCLFGERFALAVWLIVAAALDAPLELLAAKTWPQCNRLFEPVDFTNSGGVLNGTIKLSVASAWCIMAWYLSVLTGSYLDPVFYSLSQVFRS